MSVAASADEGYIKTRDALLTNENFDDLEDTHPAKLYKRQWGHLSVEDEFIVYDNCRILVPKQAREYILHLLHKSHAGVTRTLRLARRYFIWPFMKRDIEQITQECEACQERRPIQPEEPLKKDISLVNNRVTFCQSMSCIIKESNIW